MGLGRTAAAGDLFKAAISYAQRTGNVNIGEGSVITLTEQGMKSAGKVNKP